MNGRFFSKKIMDDLYLVENKMSENIGEFFIEELPTLEYDVFEVHTMNDTVHEGYNIIASTKKLPGIVHLPKNCVDTSTLELALKIMKERRHDTAGLGAPIHLLRTFIDGYKS